MKKFNNKIKLILIIIAVIWAPIVFIIVGAFLVRISFYIRDSVNLKYILSSVYDNNFKMGDLVYWYVTTIGVGITAFFSYILFKVSKRSNEIADSIRQKEEKRDREVERENAIIIHYNIIHIFKIARELFNMLINKDVELNDYSTIPSILNNEEWIKNIALISSEINSDEIDKLYDIFERAEIIRDLIVCKARKDNILDNLKILFDNSLLFNVFKYPYLMEQTNHTEKLFTTQLREIVEHIARLKYKDREINRKIFMGNYKNDKTDFVFLEYGNKLSYGLKQYVGTIKDNQFDGNGLYIDTKDKLTITSAIGELSSSTKEDKVFKDHFLSNEKYRAKFKDGRLAKGRRIEFYDNGSIWYFVDYDRMHGCTEKDVDLNIKLYKKGKDTGSFYGYLSVEKIEEIYKSKTLFEGIILNGKFNSGSGILFFANGNKKYEGNIVDEMYDGEGIEYDNKGEIVFQGIFEKNQAKTGMKFIINDYEYIESKIEDYEHISEKLRIFKTNDLLEIEYRDIRANGRSGFGTQYHDKEKMNKWYVGEYLGKERHGGGTEYYESENIKYTGNFERSHYNGNGVLYTEEGSKMYEGKFQMDVLMNGYVYLAAKKEYYEKWMDMNKPIFSYEGFIFYEGQIQDKIPNGEGKLFFGDKVVFKGQFKNNRIVKGKFYEESLKNNYNTYCNQLIKYLET